MEPPFKAYRGDRPYLFVSYAHGDSTSVYPDIARLHALGYRLWYDEGIDPSTIWTDEIYRAIKGCAGLLLYLSPRAAASDFVDMELTLAVAQLQKRVIAVHLVETALEDGLALMLSRVQAVIRYQMNDDQYLDDLRRAFRALDADLGEVSNTEAARRLVEQGLSHLTKGIFEAAEREFDAAIRLDVAAAPAYYNRGCCRFRAGRYDECLDDFRHAHEIDPSLEISQGVLKRIRFLRRLRKAEAFCRAVALWPTALWTRRRGTGQAQ